MAEETDRLLQTDREFSRYSQESTPAEAFHRYLDEQAWQLPQMSEPIQGRDAIYDGMVGGDYLLSWEPVTGLVAKSGDLGYTWGRYEMRMADASGDTVSHFGKYLNVWRRQKDGSWRVLVDMGNSSPAPEE